MLSAGAARFGWSGLTAEIGSMRESGALVGYGMATATYPTNQQQATAKAEIKSDGSAIISTAAPRPGHGRVHNPHAKSPRKFWAFRSIKLP